MKKILLVVALAFMFAGALAFSSPSLVKPHKGMIRNGAKIDCAYCHEASGAPKAGKDYAAYQKKASCQGAGCHR